MKIKLQKSSMTFQQLHEEYISTKENPRTVEGYINYYKTLARYIPPDIDVTLIDTTMVKQLTNQLATNGNKNISSNNNLTYLRVLLRYADECGYITSVPKIKMLKTDGKKKQPLTEDEIKILLKPPTNPTFAEYRDYVEINLMLATGIRSRNVREVKVSDLNLASKTLFLSSTKNGNPYTVYLSPSIVSLLRTYLNTVKLDDNMNLFPNAYGKQQSRNTFINSLKRYFAKVGLPHVSPHLLRHTYAYNLARSNVPLPIISKMLCHNSLSVTERYLNTLDSDLKEVSENIDILDQYKSKRIKL